MFDKPRWHYRFDNYKRAYFLLREICERQQQEQLEQIMILPKFWTTN